MSIKHIISVSALVPLAVGAYAIFYCRGKIILAAGRSTHVGDDIIIDVYVVTLAAALYALLIACHLRRDGRWLLALPLVASLVCMSSFLCWFWLITSGVVVSYDSMWFKK